MNYGRGNKLLDETNPTGREDRYFSKQNFEALFWISLIFGFFSLFLNNEISIYYFIGAFIFFILSKINWQSKYLSWCEGVFGLLFFIFFVGIFIFAIIYGIFLSFR